MEVYLDNAATTQMHPEVFEAMKPWMIKHYGNPSSSYALGEVTNDAVNHAREVIAKTINAEPREIYFTSGGSESDNWAIKGIMDTTNSDYYSGIHLITTPIEHKAILNTCKYLTEVGYDVSYLTTDERGMISINELNKTFRPDTTMVSVMMANNEIGTVEPIKHIADVCHERDVLFHTDAVQAYTHIPIDVKELGIDLMSVSGHKFHGPHGIGFLYVRDGIHIEPLIHGGQQEQGLRAGTENVAGIVGMAKAAEIAHEDFEWKINSMRAMKDHFVERVLNEINGVSLNGSYISSLPNVVSMTFDGVRAEAALVMLDMAGVYCSSGSACNSHDSKPSHVLTAIGRDEDYARSTLRFSLSTLNTIEQIDYSVNQIKRIVSELRQVK